jgi:hypothetical protein
VEVAKEVRELVLVAAEDSFDLRWLLRVGDEDLSRCSKRGGGEA